jgi:hypothetical protein
MQPAEDYGVSLDVRLFQYASYWSGVVDAAAQLGVTAVIACIPPSPIPYRIGKSSVIGGCATGWPVNSSFFSSG